MKKVIFLFCLFSFSCFSQEEKHPIDNAMNQCLNDAITTAEQRNCVKEAYEKWDILLNESYRQFLNKLSKNEKELLVTAQRNWIEFRDAEFAFINLYYYQQEKGTLLFVMGDFRKMEVVKKRALEIQEYIQSLEN